MKSGQSMPLLEQHKLYQTALKIVQRLAQEGARTVLAGGCVRDILLGISPGDIDLATSASPEVVEKSFPKTLAVGKAFGTIVVVEDGHNFEVTTFRKDGPYLDGRHPSGVEFSDIEEDAKRRDFTVNALFYDPLKRELIDLVDGVTDLDAGIIRTVGRARDRFQEDRLRMLRAVRFSGWLGFDIEPEVLRAIQEQASELKLVSVERIFNETKKLLESPYAIKGLDYLLQSGLHETFWPEIRGLKAGELRKFERFHNWENAFAAICILCGVADPEPRLRAWKVSKDSLKKVQQQLQAVRILKTSTVRAERVRVLGSDVYAEVTALASGLFPVEKTAGWIDEYMEVAGPDGKLPKPLLNGEDLMKAGVPAGESMGRILRELENAQYEGRLLTKEDALKWLKTLN
jgi:poly(A) polymerase